MADSTTKLILILAANPLGDLNLAKEVARIEEAIERKERSSKWEVRNTQLATEKRIRKYLLDKKPTVVHFSGHGTTNGLMLATSDDDDNAVLLAAEQVEALFELFSDTIECVVMNACWSAAHGAAIVQHIPYVVGMSKEVPDRQAIQFSEDFYDALADGRDYEFAFRYACQAQKYEELIEPPTSVLRFEQPKNPVLFSQKASKAAEEEKRTTDPEPEPDPIWRDEPMAPIRRYTCNQVRVVNRFSSNWVDLGADSIENQVFFFPSRPSSSESGLVKRLIFREMRQQQASVRYPDFDALRLVPVDCRSDFEDEDYRDAIKKAFNKVVENPQVRTLQDFISRIPTEYPTYQGFKHIPFPLFLDLTLVRWNKDIAAALTWFVRDFTKISAAAGRTFMFFVAIRAKEESVEALAGELKAFASDHAHVKVLPVLSRANEEDIHAWAMDNADTDAARTTLENDILARLGPKSTPDGWHMETIEAVLHQIITDHLNAQHGI